MTTTSLAQRMRSAAWALCLLGVLLTLLALPSHALSPGRTAVALLALGWLTWSWARDRRGRRVRRLGEAVDALAIMAVFMAAPTSATAFALPSCGIFLRTLDSSVRLAVARLTLYLGAVFAGAYAGAVGTPHGATVEAAGIVVAEGLSGLVFITAFTSLLGAALNSGQRAAENERLLTACGTRLIATASQAEVLHEATTTARSIAEGVPGVHVCAHSAQGRHVGSYHQRGGSPRLVVRLPEGAAEAEWVMDFAGPRRGLAELSRPIAVLAQQVRLAIDRCAAQEELRAQAETDGLTRLATRDVFQRALARATAGNTSAEPVASTSETPAAMVVVVDCDDFKRINDTFGHSRGDEVLVEIADRLRQVTGAGDVVARLGGDEFAVLLTADMPDRTRARVARLVDHVNAPLKVDSEERAVTCSIGSASVTRGVDASAILHTADLAMYSAKKVGKGRWVMLDDTMHEPAVAEPHLTVPAV